MYVSNSSGWDLMQSTGFWVLHLKRYILLTLLERVAELTETRTFILVQVMSLGSCIMFTCLFTRFSGDISMLACVCPLNSMFTLVAKARGIFMSKKLTMIAHTSRNISL